jgi:hypothetical protein
MTAIAELTLADLAAETYDAVFNAGADMVTPHIEYQKNPVRWIVDKLGIPERTLIWSVSPEYRVHAWDGTVDPLATVLNALADWKNVGVESGTTTGKTFLGACLVLWFLACFDLATVVTVAPKQDQLELHIWKEIGKLWPKFRRHFPTAELTTLRIRMVKGSDAWAAHGFVCGVGADEDSANKARGFHAEHMLILFEETPGIDPAIMKAFRDTCLAPHNLRAAFGNPDHQLDQLHQFCTSYGVQHVRISALDHPNVVCDNPSIVPGAASRVKIDERRIEDGEESRSFKAKVRGLSPAEASDALIKLEWCEAAARRGELDELRAPLLVGLPALGVDPSNSANGDKAAIARGRGAVLISVDAKPCPNSNQLGRDLLTEITRDGISPHHVGVDPIGVGAGTVNTLDDGLKGKGSTVQRLNGSAKPMSSIEKSPDGSTREWAADANLFINLRSQMWWQMREDLRHGRIAIPRDTALFRQLTTPTYTEDNGKVVVERKEDIKSRLNGQSPDEADAAVYWNWVRQRKAVVAPPSRPPIDRAEPLDTLRRKHQPPPRVDRWAAGKRWDR